ncbi:MAG: N-acetylneuraminate synthase [Kofleriaceae bacterium]|nr:N-acetylneuraminate synthase [Kofleriaceae bacterium]
MRRIRIQGSEIGEGRPTFVIAEAGVNHNGQLDLAERLVDVAADAGCDAVKFQTFDPDLLAAPSAAKAAYQRETTGTSGSQRDMLRGLVLSREAHARLQERATQRGLQFLSTPFDESSADFLEALGVPAFKISSGDLTNHLLLRHVASKRRPVLISTGMATLDEVNAAIATLTSSGATDIAVFHCVSNYPAQPADCNLRAIATLREATGRPVGWSDHTLGTDVTVAAVALGAELIEKHFTLDRTLPGPDHHASLEPDQLAAMVRGIRAVETALGDGIKMPRPSEADVAAVARRSLCYRTDLAAGTTLAAHDLIALRPGTGLSTAHADQVAGRRLQRSVQRGELVAWTDLES